MFAARCHGNGWSREGRAGKTMDDDTGPLDSEGTGEGAKERSDFWVMRR